MKRKLMRKALASPLISFVNLEHTDFLGTRLHEIKKKK